MKKIIYFLIFTISFPSILMAQDGKPHVKIFSNFNYDVSNNSNNSDNYKEFEIKRSYLGYSYNFDDSFSTKVTFDVGKNSAGSSYTAFLKIASLTWKANDNTTLNFGMVGTKNFKFMEKAWGKRYIYKSLQDENKWANSADLGLTLDYKLSDNLSLDFQVLNGEGYKNLQSADGLMRSGAGLIYKQGNYSLRASTDYIPSEFDSLDDQVITTLAGVMKMNSITVGGEYNIMENTGNILDNTKIGISIYGNYKIDDNLSLFGRYDKITSEDAEENKWDRSNDGKLTIVGVERKMTKGVTLSLNMQTSKDGQRNSEESSIFYLNIECKL